VLSQLRLCREFYIRGSVHRNSKFMKSKEIQQYADISLLQNHSTYFGCLPHPSSEVHKIVGAASGTNKDQSLFGWGTALAQWLRCCATNRKVAGSIPA